MLSLCAERFEPVRAYFGGGVTRTPEWRQKSTRRAKSRYRKLMANA